MRRSLWGGLATLGLLALVAAAPAAAQTHHDDYDHHGRGRRHSREHDGHRRQTLAHTVTDLLRHGTTNSHSSASHYYRDHYDARGYRTYRSNRRDSYRNRGYYRDAYDDYGYSTYGRYDRYDSYDRCH